MNHHPQAVKRIEHVFDLFDTDGNGFIEAADIELMTKRVVAAAAGSGQGAKDAIRAAFDRYWTTMAAELDANGDGRISLEEFRLIVLSPERFGPAVEQFAEALSALGDPDGDGLIERPVFEALMTAIGFGRENLHALFDSFGPTEQDQVEVEVWRTAIVEFYDPDDGDTRGNHLIPAQKR
jgi:Ca2+-binding EF-hand superfamily protein